ncbi:hypothetical protein ANCDUO_11845 [Ancylostoma duodenale]|uniref:Uncharacterized protein n=1 Tax=Ancylostoma duodenale TaxID=51022 RepID=A0A0C2GGL6_9BILA|nr:hypothetical protein ANCDUO_11845 [Ancylostoma duodenale]
MYLDEIENKDNGNTPALKPPGVLMPLSWQQRIHSKEDMIVPVLSSTTVEQPDIGLDDDFESETVMEQDEDKENEADSMETDEGYGKRREVCLMEYDEKWCHGRRRGQAHEEDG